MERELKERKWKGNMRGRQAVLIPGIFFWGGIAKTYNSPPTAAKLRSLSLFWPGQGITNISRKLHFNGQ